MTTEQTNRNRGMTEEEQEIGDLIYDAIQAYSRDSERSQQAKEFKAGISDLGFCSERLRRMIDQQVPEDTDYLKAFIGTALGDHMEKAVAAVDPDCVVQAEVEVVLHGDEGRTYRLPGHPDMIFRKRGLMIDGKTSFGLQLARRSGRDDVQKMFQRHLYGVGAFNAGLFDPAIGLEDVRVGNAWLDRSGNEQAIHVAIEKLDLDVVEEAGRWLDEVRYAFVNKTEAPKEPPREMCAATCGFFRVCREFDTDVSGLLTDPVIVAAAKLYDEMRAMEKVGKYGKEEAKAALFEINGSTGEYMIRNTWVNATENRAGYWSLGVTKIK